MNDYTIEAKEYARAVFSNAGFQNPLRFAEGSCFGVSSNCEIVPLAGSETVPDAAILLGTTAANQMSVPQNPDYWLNGLDRDSEQSVLDALLTRGTRDDAYMVTAIRAVAGLRELPPISSLSK